MEGDEYCDDELNYNEFAYDGGDCCQGTGNQYKALHYCTECRCKKEYDGWKQNQKNLLSLMSNKSTCIH